MIELFYFNQCWDLKRYNLSRSVDLGMMAMNEYSAFPKAPEIESYNRMF